MKTLVFGGSFDPPHLGHAALLRAAIKAIKPDRIVIVPAFQAPLKGEPSTSAAKRLALVKLWLRSLNKWTRRRSRLDLAELRSKRRVYTVETLSRLKGELHFVVGSDSAAAFWRWKDPARLRRLATWWTARRPGGAKPPSFFHLVPGKMPDVSSTEIRRRLALGEPVDGLLAPRVEKLIRKRKLYGLALLEELERSLKPGRYEHTLCVARLADELAGERARLAGLLHDCGRALRIDEMPAYARRRRLKVPHLAGVLRHNPNLLHAFIGADLARRRYGVEDREILAAIRDHTLGRPGMGPLERALYVADACSEDRRYPEAKRLRALARRDLSRAFVETVRQKRRFVAQDGAWKHPLTDRLWDSLRRP